MKRPQFFIREERDKEFRFSELLNGKASLICRKIKSKK